jgi:hypothetical protein
MKDKDALALQQLPSLPTSHPLYTYPSSRKFLCQKCNKEYSLIAGVKVKYIATARCPRGFRAYVEIDYSCGNGHKTQKAGWIYQHLPYDRCNDGGDTWRYVNPYTSKITGCI